MGLPLSQRANQQLDQGDNRCHHPDALMVNGFKERRHLVAYMGWSSMK